MTLEFRTSYGTTIALLLLCPLLLFFGAMAIASGRTVGWLLVVVAPLGFLSWLRALLRPNPQVVIDEFAIEDRRAGVGPIPWNEITALEVHEMAGNVALNIEVRDLPMILAALPLHRRLALRSRRLYGRSPLSVNFTNLKPDVAEALDFIETTGVLDRSSGE